MVTGKTVDGTPVGFTANSFTSVSLDPPLLLVCPAKSLSCYEVFKHTTHFAVNILAEGQQHISNLFASPSEDRFAETDWTFGEMGCPLIAGAAVQFECSKWQWIDAGDHSILMGEIKAFHNAEKDGLGYSRQGYFDLAMERKAQELQASASTVKVGAIVEYEGEVLLVQENDRWILPSTTVDHELGSLNSLSKTLETLNLEVSFGPIYSIFEDTKNREYHIYYRALATNRQAPDGGEYFPLDAFLLSQLDATSIKSMMTRYVNEHEAHQFGIYYGDTEDGVVQLISEGR